MGIFNLNEKKYDITFISRKDSAHFAEPILSELKKKYVIQHLSPEHKYQYNHWQVKGEVIWVEWAHKFAREVSKKKWKHWRTYASKTRKEVTQGSFRRDFMLYPKLVFCIRSSSFCGPISFSC